MIPRMRPSSTRRLTPSSATVVPKALRRPRASMHAIASALPFRSIRGRLAMGGIEQFFRCQAEPLDGGMNPGPLLREKFLAFAPEQKIVSAGFHVHAETTLLLDE